MLSSKNTGKSDRTCSLSLLFNKFTLMWPCNQTTCGNTKCSFMDFWGQLQGYNPQVIQIEERKKIQVFNTNIIH